MSIVLTVIPRTQSPSSVETLTRWSDITQMGNRAGVLRASIRESNEACERILEHLEDGRTDWAATLVRGLMASQQELLARIEQADTIRARQKTQHQDSISQELIRSRFALSYGEWGPEQTTGSA